MNKNAISKIQDRNQSTRVYRNQPLIIIPSIYNENKEIEITKHCFNNL